MEMKGWTYARAGVDIDQKSRAIKSLVDKIGFRRYGIGRKADLDDQFTGLIEFGDLFLTLCTDGVGTKLLIAQAMNRWDTVGIDCIAMNVNDTICVGAEPIAFVDYVAIDHPDEWLTGELGKGLEAGAKEANIDIVGGEIAVLPELVNGVDISGTCLGFVTREGLITGEEITPGDVIIGLPSSGIHSNGLTLARKILEANEIDYEETAPALGCKIGEELLRPTKIYVRDVLEIINKVKIKGMVNITGGGLRNFLRLKKGVRFEITDPMEPQKIFHLLAELGQVDTAEMYQTFNMGMGFALICDEKDETDILRMLGESKRVGEVVDGEGVALPSLGIEYFTY